MKRINTGRVCVSPVSVIRGAGIALQPTLRFWNPQGLWPLCNSIELGFSMILKEHCKILRYSEGYGSF